MSSPDIKTIDKRLLYGYRIFLGLESVRLAANHSIASDLRQVRILAKGPLYRLDDV